MGREVVRKPVIGKFELALVRQVVMKNSVDMSYREIMDLDRILDAIEEIVFVHISDKEN